MKEIRFLIDWREKFKKGDMVNFDDRGADEFVRLGYAEFTNIKTTAKIQHTVTNNSDIVNVSTKKEIKQNISRDIDKKPSHFVRSSTQQDFSTNHKSVSRVWAGGGVYSGLPPKIKKQINEQLAKEIHKNLYLFIKADFDKVTWDFIRKTSSDYSLKNKRLIFIGLYNTSCRLKVISQEEKQKVNMMLMSSGEKEFYFIDQPPRTEIKIRNFIPFNTHVYGCLIDGMVQTCYYTGTLKQGVSYHAYAIKYPNFTARKNNRSLNAMCEYCYIIGEAFEIRDEYELINEVLPNITKPQDLSLVWDYLNDEPIFSDDEILILTINTFFVKHGLSALDLILCGRAGCKKSGWVEALAHLFDSKVIDGVRSTYKSLVPSFYSNQKNHGELIQSQEICIIDDFFRMFSQQSDLGRIPLKTAIIKGLEEIMTILDRKERTFSSGKGEDFQITARMEASFIATDNATYLDDMQSLYNNEKTNTKPIFRRFNFLVLSDASQEKGASVPNKEEELVYHNLNVRLSRIWGTKSVKLMFRLMMGLMRIKARQVEYDEKTVKLIADKIWKLPHQRESAINALMCGVVVINHVFRARDINGITTNADEKDYADFERLFKRIHDDYCKIVGFIESPPITHEKVENKGSDAQKQLTGEKG